jgi:hypothetical protein
MSCSKTLSNYIPSLKLKTKFNAHKIEDTIVISSNLIFNFQARDVNINNSVW